MRFVVPGRPVPKGRPRSGRGRTYTPKTTVDYEQAVALACRTAMTAQGAQLVPRDVPLVIELHVYADRVEVDIDVVPDLAVSKLRGDADNYAKAVLDGSEGVAFENDKQVSRLVVVKH